MKRKVLCVFSLIAYLLIFCTLFAPMAEREMAVQVELKHLTGSKNYNPQLGAYCSLWWEEEGLFQVVDGKGWSVGKRAALVAPIYYSVIKDFYGTPVSITMHPGTEYYIILSASRAPHDGDLVEPVETVDSVGEKLVLYFPEGGSVLDLQSNFTVLKTGEQGVLLDTKRTKLPFFEHRMYQSLIGRVSYGGDLFVEDPADAKALMEDISLENFRIYSLTDAQSFLEQLPLLASMIALLLTGVVLWGGTWWLSRREGKKAPIFGNIALLLLTLAAMLPITKAIDLPASFMPTYSILDVGHYVKEFQNLFTAMASYGDTALSAAFTRQLYFCGGLLLAAVVLPLALVFLESRIGASRNRKRKLIQ